MYDIQPNHIQRIADTRKHAIKENTRKDYRTRLRRMIDWSLKEYPQFADCCIREVTEEEKLDVTKTFSIKQHMISYTTNSTKRMSVLSWHS